MSHARHPPCTLRMKAITITTWEDRSKYRTQSHGAGDFRPGMVHVRAASDYGGRINFMISREAFDRLPGQYDIGHILAEGGTIL